MDDVVLVVDVDWLLAVKVFGFTIALLYTAQARASQISGSRRRGFSSSEISSAWISSPKATPLVMFDEPGWDVPLWPIKACLHMRITVLEVSLSSREAPIRSYTCFHPYSNSLCRIQSSSIPLSSTVKWRFEWMRLGKADVSDFVALVSLAVNLSEERNEKGPLAAGAGDGLAFRVAVAPEGHDGIAPEGVR